MRVEMNGVIRQERFSKQCVNEKVASFQGGLEEGLVSKGLFGMGMFMWLEVQRVVGRGIYGAVRGHSMKRICRVQRVGERGENREANRKFMHKT